MPDCQIRAICAGIGYDYEAACEKLNVSCVKGSGFSDEKGIDLYDVHDTFKKFLGPMQDMTDLFDDPVQALLNGISLNDWLEQHATDNKTYLIHLDDNKEMDGGHIICAKCYGSKTFFVDTFDCGEMFVQAFCQIERVLKKDSRFHWKYDEKTKKFI